MDREAPSATTSRLDVIVLGILALTLVPAILTNALLLYERLAGIGLHDPFVGGDPIAKQRPLIAPVVVVVAGVARLVLVRVWPLGRGHRRLLLGLIVLALLLLAASQVPQPTAASFYAPG